MCDEFWKKEFSGTIDPYYEGFKGDIIKLDDSGKKYLIKGKYEVIGHDTVRITELPVGVWTSPYKAFLEKLMEDKDSKGKKKKPVVKSYIDSCTDTNIDFTVKLHIGVLPNLVSKKIDNNINLFEKTFGLTTTKSTTNMYLFDEEQKLRKYNDVYDIINKYIPVRYKTYVARKENIIASLEKEVRLLSNKAKFIHEQIVEPPTIILRKKKKHEVIEMLKSKNYDTIDDDEEYKYLRSMPIDSVEEENYEKLLNQKGLKEKN